MSDTPIKIALCVGINYDGADSRVPALRFAEPDAQGVADLLRGRGFAVTTLLGRAATRRAILGALDGHGGADADLLVLYFAGHGLHGSRVLDQGEVYFAPHDFDPDDTTLALPLTALASAFEARFHAQNAFALFDCCYAGVMAGVAINTDWSSAGESWRQALKPREDEGTRGSAQPAGAAPAASRSRALIAACPGNMAAREIADLAHGAATYYALEGWQGKAADPESGRITEAHLYAYINARLTDQRLPPLSRAAQIGDVVLDQIAPIVQAATPTASNIPWPGDCRLIDTATIETAKAQAAHPGAVSLYARPGQHAFWHIVASQDVRRDITDRVLSAIQVLGDTPGMRFQLITSAEGDGKSAFLLRLSYELAAQGEHVLVPLRESQALDATKLETACRAVAADSQRSGRRVYLLIDNAYRYQGALLGTLTTYPIDNLTILATSRYNDIQAELPVPAPALPIATCDPAGPATFDPVDLPGLNESEAHQLIERIRSYGTIQAAQVDKLPHWIVDERLPLLVAVLGLTTAGGIDEYVRRRLIEVNNGRDPALEDQARWEPFMRLYWPIALCRSWGAYVPQSVLPALSGLPARQVTALLCGGPSGEPTGMAREYLRGNCGGTWRTDHQIIARATIRYVAPDVPMYNLVGQVLQQISTAPSPDAAELVGNLLHRFAASADLILDQLQSVILPDVRTATPDQLLVTLSPGQLSPTGVEELSNTLKAESLPADGAGAPGETLATPSSLWSSDSGSLGSGNNQRGREIFSAQLDDPHAAALLATLRKLANSTDLLIHYAPSYLLLERWADLVDTTTLALADPLLLPVEQAHALAARAQAYGHLGRLADAHADYTQALAILPDDSFILNSRAMTYSGSGHYEQALADYMQILAHNPDNPGVLNNRGLTYRHMRRYDEALADFDHSLLLRHDDPGTLNNRGITYRRLRRYDAALTDFNRALELQPQDAGTLINRGNVYRQLHRFEDALADYSRSLALDPDLLAARNNRGCTYRHLGRYDQALADYDTVLAAHPDDPKVLHNRGTAYYYLGRYDAALADFTRALELRPTYPATLTNRGATYDNQGRFAEALAEYTRSLEVRPDHASTLYNRGCTYRHLDRPADALADFSRAIEVRPAHPRALNNRGLTLHALGRDAEALADFTRSLEIRPDYPLTLYNRAATYIRLGRAAEALTDLLCALENLTDEARPLAAKIHHSRGLLLAESGNYADAVADYTWVLDRHPDHHEARHGRGIAYYHLARYPEALEDLTATLAGQPDEAGALHLRGCTLLRLGRPAEAEADLTRAHALRPTDPAIQHDLAIARDAVGSRQSAETKS